MPQERVAMRIAREILRLAWSCSQSGQAIAISCGVGKTTVSDTLSRAHAANLSWPLPFSLDDEGLEALLYPASSGTSRHKHSLPDWNALNSEFDHSQKPHPHAVVAGVQGTESLRISVQPVLRSVSCMAEEA